jgi:DNA-binding NarL/FixJ family response regulator
LLDLSQRVTRVMIVEDHPLMRKGLREAVEAAPDFEVCGEADGAPAALEMARHAHPDLAIVDLSLREGSGLDLVKCLHAEAPGVRVLVVSMHDEALYAQRALRSGALGYISKTEPEERLRAALREIMQGRIALSGPTAQRILKRSVGSQEAHNGLTESLSDRELEVLELLGEGISTRGIAAKLHLSVKTIETYREKLKSKLQLADGAALARYAAVWVHEHTE